MCHWRRERAIRSSHSRSENEIEGEKEGEKKASCHTSALFSCSWSLSVKKKKLSNNKSKRTHKRTFAQFRRSNAHTKRRGLEKKKALGFVEVDVEVCLQVWIGGAVRPENKVLCAECFDVAATFLDCKKTRRCHHQQNETERTDKKTEKERWGEGVRRKRLFLSPSWLNYAA